MILANIVLDPAAIAAWLVGGLASGWLAGKMMAEPSYGSVGDLVLGAIGGLVGGLLFGFFKDGAGFWGALALALAGAWICIISGRTFVAWRSQ